MTRAGGARARGWARAAAALGLVAAGGCGSSEPDGGSSARAGRLLAAGVMAAVARAAPLAEPFRCAELSPAAPGSGPAAAELDRRAGRPLALDGDWLRMGPPPPGHDRTLIAGVVADARGASAATLAQLGRVRAEFEREKVELVVSLGGMGTGQEELAQVLSALARDATWVVWAIPGEREAIPAHRAAVAGLAARGEPVFDGSRVRMIDVDGVVLAAFPGDEEPAHLLAGAEGCVHRPEDASALAARLAGQKGVRVWAGHAPPRQREAQAGDVSLGGVHVGERALADTLPAARAHLVLHGLVDEAALGEAAGRADLREGRRALVLGAGPVEAMPIAGAEGAVFGGTALVVRISAGEDAITWRRVRFPLGGSVSAR